MSVQTAQLTPERIMQLAWGYAPPLIIEAAIKHKIFDILEGQPKTVDEVREATGASERGLHPVMNALVGLDLLRKEKGERYSLTPESATFLVSTKPGFQGGLFKHISSQLMAKWMHLSDIVRSGRPPAAMNQQDEGSGFFEQFVNDIFPMSYPAAEALAKSLRIDQAKEEVRVLDLAAGSGVWGIALARQSDHVRVTAVDWPGVLKVTEQTAKRFGVADRLQMVAGDLLDAEFGSGYHVATLGHILHSEGEVRSRILLEKTFGALAPGGTIAIAEFLVNDQRTGPPIGLLFAVNMLVHTEQGDTFSFNEIAGWLREAGFVDVRTLEAPGPSPLILATKPSS